MDDEPTPFTINISQNVLDDLKERLAKTRFPNELENVGWKYGADMTTLKEYVEYWKNDFDWRAQETYLNSFKHFKLRCNDLSIHFIHERSTNPNAIPLILSHGWPDSFFGFHKIIKKLMKPEDENAQAFHVVVPSLPGFGFSEAPKQAGFDADEVAKTLNQLMIKLGYTKYVAHGGDWGGVISYKLALNYPQNCTALHLNFVAVYPPNLWNPFAFLRMIAWIMLPKTWVYGQAAKERIDRFQEFQKNEDGYFHIQSKRPQSLGYGLNDSPTGLLGWILEKFHDWCDNYNKLTKDEILTNVSIYWFTESITSSMRLYKEHKRKRLSYIRQPTGISVFPREVYMPPRSWVECSFNVQSWVEHDSGGHFAAFETPDELSNDIRQFFKSNVVKKAIESSR